MWLGKENTLAQCMSAPLTDFSINIYAQFIAQDINMSVARFEAEVVAMTAALLGSKEMTSGGQICGNLTSGGTESIPLAVKTSHDYMKAKKGITKPEMIIAESAHSAYDKAAQYFNIKIRHVPVTKEMIADVKGIKRCINKNTILVMASDGLWDVISNEDVVSIIKDTVKEPSMCSKRLATEAAARGSGE